MGRIEFISPHIVESHIHTFIGRMCLPTQWGSCPCMNPVQESVKWARQSAELTMVIEIKSFTGKHSKENVWLQGKATVYVYNRNEYSEHSETLQLFNLLRRITVKIDAMFKISTKQQELTHYQYEILSGLKEQWEGNYRAKITLISKEDALIELCFPIGNGSLIKNVLEVIQTDLYTANAELRKSEVY